MSYNGYNYQSFDNQDYQSYDSSANAFAAQGGGFLTNNATGFDSPADTPQKKGKSGSTNQTLTPVTIRQLLLATQSAPEDGFKVDNVTIYQVTIVGTIMSIAERNTNMTLSLDDSTGRIDVQIWLDADDQNDYMNQKRHMWREGLYVRVIGHLRVFQSKKSVVAFRIQPIIDFNEITYHYLEATYVHLFHTRGAVQTGSVNQLQGVPAQNNVNSVSSGNRWGGQYSGLHSQVLQVFKSHRSTEGLSIQFVAEQLGKPDYEIRNIVEFLTTEGHLYTTIDEDHFSPTTV